MAEPVAPKSSPSPGPASPTPSPSPAPSKGPGPTGEALRRAPRGQRAHVHPPRAATSWTAAFLPNRALSKTVMLGLTLFWLAAAFLLWLVAPWKTLPGPGEVWNALGSLWWEHGMGPELFTTLRLIFHALFLTVVISMLL